MYSTYTKDRYRGALAALEASAGGGGGVTLLGGGECAEDRAVWVSVMLNLAATHLKLLEGAEAEQVFFFGYAWHSCNASRDPRGGRGRSSFLVFPSLFLGVSVMLNLAATAAKHLKLLEGPMEKGWACTCCNTTNKTYADVC